MTNLKLGSLFDGSGGFPLGGLLSGITPIWASEVEPFAVRVTTKRLRCTGNYKKATFYETLRRYLHDGRR